MNKQHCQSEDNSPAVHDGESAKDMKRTHYRGTLAAIIIVGSLWLWFRGTESRPKQIPTPTSPVLEHTYPVMGTLAKVTLYGQQELTEKAADAVRDVFMQVQKTCNIFNPESELSRLNATAAQQPFKCSPLLWLMLKQAERAYQVSNGSFDVTARPLMQLWGFYREQVGELPKTNEVEKTLKLVGMDKVEFDEQQCSIAFSVPGMSLDLGGIAKGFAVDLAVEKVIALGVKQGVIDLGGNMFCLPQPPPAGSNKYTIGIRNPLQKDKVCATVKLLNRGIATSGNYERYVTINGKHYTHIIDPRTGFPVENMLSVSVVTPKAGDADFLSTATFINGADFAEKMTAKFPHTSFLIIKRNKETPSTIETFNTGLFKFLQ